MYAQSTPYVRPYCRFTFTGYAAVSNQKGIKIKGIKRFSYLLLRGQENLLDGYAHGFRQLGMYFTAWIYHGYSACLFVVADHLSDLGTDPGSDFSASFHCL